MAATIPTQLLVEAFDRFAFAHDVTGTRYAEARAKLGEIIDGATR